MKRHLTSSLFFLAFLVSACAQQQSNVVKLAPADFQTKLNQTTHVQLLDVRTSDEFSGGHLANAINVDWNGADFEKRIDTLDKSVPVFVYCLSGGRSSKAASLLHEKGFSEVYELDGGMMKWRAAGLPEETNAVLPAETGMTTDEYNRLISNPEKAVLIDFYAEWCAPCKKMEPVLNEIAAEMPDDVIIIRIDSDKNATLCKELQVESIPVLLLYKDGLLVWRKQGLTEKAEIIQQLN